MSLWDRIRRGLGLEAPRATTDEGATSHEAASAGEAVAEAPATAERSSDVELLTKAGQPRGPTAPQLLAALARSRGTPHEAQALSALAAPLTRGGVPDSVRVACADLYVDRGESDAALALLAETTSVGGMLLASDLHAARGDQARALCLVERVLARAIDAPGAKERHARLSETLGSTSRRRAAPEQPTVVATLAPRSELQIVREAARGGAATIYAARDTALGRLVAFKVYHSPSDAREAVTVEARATAAVAGAGVVTLLDASPEQGWVALEWVERGSVRDALARGDVDALLPMQVWLLGLARALARVHEAGLVHADVKPANVLLRAPGDAVLTDFGIARPIGQGDPAGSPGYLSPERVAGRAGHPRDDVYGFGRVIEDVLAALEGADLSAGSDPSHESLRLLTLRCLGPDELRPSSGSELVDALAAIGRN